MAHHHTHPNRPFVQTWTPPAPTGSGTNIYVAPAANGGSDSNAGTIGSPKLTLHGADAIATAGSVIHVAPGAYQMGTPTLSNLTAAGTSSNRIVFWSTTLHGATLTGGLSPGANNPATLVYLQGSFVDFMGFEVDGTAATGAVLLTVGIYSEASSHPTVQYNVVHNFINNTTDLNTVTTSSEGGAGIDMRNYLSQMTTCTVNGNIIYNIGPTGSGSSLVHGLYMAGPGIYSNNLVYDSCDGITSFHEFINGNCINNTVDNCGNGTNGGGIEISGSPTAASGCNVNNNVVSNSAGWGIVEQSGGTHTGANTYLNNTLYNITGINWQLFNGNTNVNSLTSDPLYVNRSAKNFQLQSASPELGSGTTTSPTTPTNIVGQTRGSPPNRGCY